MRTLSCRVYPTLSVNKSPSRHTTSDRCRCLDIVWTFFESFQRPYDVVLRRYVSPGLEELKFKHFSWVISTNHGHTCLINKLCASHSSSLKMKPRFLDNSEISIVSTLLKGWTSGTTTERAERAGTTTERTERPQNGPEQPKLPGWCRGNFIV